MAVNSLRDRIKFVINKYGATVYSLTDNQSERVRLNRQINQDTQISADTASFILDKFEDISADWLLRGEGPIERTKIVTPPAQHHHQEIHSDGAPIAITQSGDAHVDALPADTKKEQVPSAPAPIDVEKMFRDQDWAMVVSLIRQHDQELLAYKDTLLAMKDEQIAQLRHDIEMLDGLLRSITPSPRTK